MRKNIFISLAKGTFRVSQGDHGFKTFDFYNFDDLTPTIETTEILDGKTKENVSVLVSPDAIKISKRGVSYAPVIHHVFSNLEKNLKLFRQFLRTEFSTSRILKPRVIVVIPDDYMEADRRLTLEFLTETRLFKQIIFSETAPLIAAPDELEHCITITQSTRNLAVSWLHYNGVVKQELSPLGSYSVEQVNALITSWCNQLTTPRPTALLFGDSLDTLASLGSVVSEDRFFPTFNNIGILLGFNGVRKLSQQYR